MCVAQWQLASDQPSRGQVAGQLLSMAGPTQQTVRRQPPRQRRPSHEVGQSDSLYVNILP